MPTMRRYRISLDEASISKLLGRGQWGRPRSNKALDRRVPVMEPDLGVQIEAVRRVQHVWPAGEALLPPAPHPAAEPLRLLPLATLGEVIGRAA